MRTEEEIFSDVSGKILSVERQEEAIKWHKDEEAVNKKSLDSKKIVTVPGESLESHMAKRQEEAIKWHKDKEVANKKSLVSRDANSEAKESIDSYMEKRQKAATDWHKERDTSPVSAYDKNIDLPYPEGTFWKWVEKNKDKQ